MVKIMVVVILTVAGMLGGQADLVSARATTPPAGFDALQQEIAGLSDRILRAGLRTSLGVKVAAARRDYERGDPCAAVNVLGAYLNETQALRRGATTAIADRLFNDGWRLRQDVLATVDAGPCAEPAMRAEPDVAIRLSDVTHLESHVTFGEPVLWTVDAGGEVWTRVEIPGLKVGGAPGLPAVPVFRRLVGVPHGANVSIRATATVADAIRMNLYPVQPEPNMRDLTPDDFLTEPPPPSVFADKPFTKDAPAYAVNAPYPAELCTARVLGQARDLRIAQIECAAAQYNPVTDELRRFGAIDLVVSFVGGDGYFVTTASLNPFDTASTLYQSGVLNKETLPRYVGADLLSRFCYGEEFLILAHPGYRTAADKLAQWKQSQGLLTSVFEVNDGAGPGPDTPDEIRAFIAERYFSCVVRPSYVLLFGDWQQVPFFVVPRLPVGSGEDIPTDYPYSLVTKFEDDVVDLFMDMRVGRLNVPADQAEAFVDRIIQYEGSPPTDAGFYAKAMIASQFDCCRTDVKPDGWDQRTFIQTVEDLRDRLFYKDVQRVYTKTIETLVDGYSGDGVPRAYSDGTPLPFELSTLVGYPWNGEPEDIIAAIDDGRFLAVHLDHGYNQGWVNPRFVFSDVNKLTNGDKLPFVLSYNCDSGYFDSDGDVFTHALLRNPNGGAIGVVAATRTTYATGNVMIKGSLDAAFPDLIPNFGVDVASARLGDMLDHGRQYMLSQYGANTPDVINHLNLYILFGDPTVAMWTENPYSIPLPLEALVLVVPEFIKIWYGVDGATITAWQESRGVVVPVGRGVVRDGVATLGYVTAPLDGVPLQFAASKPNAVGVRLRVSDAAGR